MRGLLPLYVVTLLMRLAYERFVEGKYVPNSRCTYLVREQTPLPSQTLRPVGTSSLEARYPLRRVVYLDRKVQRG